MYGTGRTYRSTDKGDAICPTLKMRGNEKSTNIPKIEIGLVQLIRLAIMFNVKQTGVSINTQKMFIRKICQTHLCRHFRIKSSHTLLFPH